MTTHHVHEAKGDCRVTLWHRYSEIAAGDGGNAPAFAIDGGQLWGHYVQQNPPTLNAQVSQRCQLEAGSWAGQIHYFGNNQCGKLTIYLLSLDTNEQVTILSEIDTYAAGYNAGNLFSFNVLMTGAYRVQWKCTGRNLANLTPFYRLYITVTELWRTGA